MIAVFNSSRSEPVSSDSSRSTATSAPSSTYSSATAPSSTPTWASATLQYAPKYAAIAISPGTFNSAWTRNYADQEIAKAEAVASCSELASDCIPMAWSADGGCVAVAVDKSVWAYAGGYGSSLSQAQNAAIAKLGTANPQIQSSTCNTS
jgi:hypothetical protein